MQRLLYRILISAFAVAVLSRLAAARDWSALRARLGHGADRARRPHLWLHAASNGELASARPVIAALTAARPDLPLIVTCNSASGVALAHEMGLAAALAPLDLRHAARCFAARWRVTGHISMESELWPNRIATVPGPCIVLGGRLTERTARGWGKLPAVARAMLARIDLLSAQDAASLARFRALGLPDRALGPVADLKALYTPPGAVTPDRTLAAAFPREATWLAASTHAGEEEVVIDAHLAARAREPGLRLILAPRHPARGDAVAALLQAAGLAYARRSEGALPEAEVLLADTLGEMALWYALAGRVFVGGSLGDRGGHTPYEPAHYGAALIHGPDTGNFAAPYAALRAAGASVAISDAPALAAALAELSDPMRQAEQGARAQAALQPQAGVDALAARIVDLLPQATAERGGRGGNA